MILKARLVSGRRKSCDGVYSVSQKDMEHLWTLVAVGLQLAQLVEQIPFKD